MITIGGTATAPQPNHTDDYDEFVRVSHNIFIAPARLAVFGFAAVGVNEITEVVAPNTLGSG